jgi:hypothetical protein
MKLTKEQTITLSWSTVVSIAGSLGAVWAFAAPIAGQALRDQIQTEIAKELKPLKATQEAMQAAQIITISATVRNLENAITALEYKRDMCMEAECWTIRDAQDLTSARNDLRAAQDALKALRQ